MNKNIPNGLAPHILMSEPNELIEIHKGIFTLVDNNKSYTIDGTIHYKWSNTSNIIFQGEYLDNYIGYDHIRNIHNVYIDNQKVAVALIENSVNGERTTVRGRIGNCLEFGSNEQSCDKFCFSFFNMKNFLGDAIQCNENSFSLNRLTFTSGEYEIIVENRQDYKDVTNKLNHSTDEYYITHYCQVSKIGSTITYSEVHDILYAFSSYISFVFGKRHIPIFIYGYLDDAIIYKRYESIQMPSLSYVHTWTPQYGYEGVQASWDTFLSKWQESKDNKDILTTATHWYLESNMGSGAMEGSYILAFAGIELMYNVLIGKTFKDDGKQLYFKEEAKVSKLCTLLQIEDIICAKDIVEVRDCLVHYGGDNRTKYNQIIDVKNRYNKLLYLLERLMLRYLEYQGKITDRLNKEIELVVNKPNHE